MDVHVPTRPDSAMFLILRRPTQLCSWDFNNTLLESVEEDSVVWNRSGSSDVVMFFSSVARMAPS